MKLQHRIRALLTAAFFSLTLSNTMLQPFVTWGDDAAVSLTLGAEEVTLGMQTDALHWQADISGCSTTEESTLYYVGTMDTADATYLTAYPIRITPYEDGVALDPLYYYWGNSDVTLEDHIFSIALPKDSTGAAYDAYTVSYYTAAATPCSARGAVQQEDDTLVTTAGFWESSTPAPQLYASISNATNGLRYEAYVTVPAGNAGAIFQAGGGMTITNNETGETHTCPLNAGNVEDVVVTLTAADGTSMTLTPYSGSGSPDNTYFLTLSEDDDSLYAIHMYCNAADTEDSAWIWDEEMTMHMALTIPYSVVDENGSTLGSHLDADKDYTIANHFYVNIGGETSTATAEFCPVVKTSSDLNQFLTSANIYDSNNTLQVGTDTSGNTVSNTLYASQSYQYELVFSDRSTPGNYLYMAADTWGGMIYTIPSALHVSDDTEPHTITLANGKAVGDFIIQDQQIKVQFYYVDKDGNSTDADGNPITTTWLESDGIKTLTLRFSGTFSEGMTDQIDLQIGSALTVNVYVEDDAALAVEKTAGTYDPATHTMDYTVTVSGTSGAVEALTLTDQITSRNGRLLPDSVTAEIQGSTVEATLVCTAVDGDPYTYRISGFPSLQKEEVLTVRYKVKLNDNNTAYRQASGSIALKNHITGNGKTPQGKTITGSDDAACTIPVVNLSKSGSSQTIGKTPVIAWKILVGDGSSSVDGVTLSDTLGDGVSLYTNKKISVVGTHQDGTTTESTLSWNSSNVSQDPFQITLPSSTDATNPFVTFTVTYYTTYSKANNDGSNVATNSVRARINNYTMNTTASFYSTTESNITNFQKSGQRVGDALEWTISMEIPASMYNTQGFYIGDEYKAAIVQEDGTLNYDTVSPIPDFEDVTVTIQTASGTTVLTPYTTGSDATNTFLIRRSQSGKYQYILFHSTGKLKDSTWLTNEDAVLTITYRVPLDETTKAALDSGGYVKNIARTYIGEDKQKDRVDASVNGIPMKKSGSQNADDPTLIDYKVTLYNQDATNGGVLMDSGAAQSMVFTDTYDAGLVYQQGSLKVMLQTFATSSSASRTVATFTYSGTADESQHQLSVTAEDFKNSSGTTLAAYVAQNGFPSNGYNFVFSYQLRAENLYTAKASSLTFSNTAHLQWGTDDNQSVTAKATVTCKTGLLTKSTVNAPTDGETLSSGNIVTYQIDLNPHAIDIDPNSDTLVVLDTLPDCLSLIWDDTVTCESWDAAHETWVPETSAQKSYYTENGKHILRFQVPDSQYIRLSYRCQVVEYGTNVEIVNSVRVQGTAPISDMVRRVFQVQEKTGSAGTSTQQFSLVKTDATTHAPMADVTFLLYGSENRNIAPADASIPAHISDDTGTYYYIGAYTTDAEGHCVISNLRYSAGTQHKYVLREITPTGYEPAEDLYIAYTENPDSGTQEGFLNVYKDETLPIVNQPISVTLPATGGCGTTVLYFWSSLLTLGAAGGLIFRFRKR
jgi:hypothetical protein